MLVEFSVSNSWSFKDLQTLPMQAAKIASKNHQLDEHNVFAASDELELLKTKAIFGANASGKSNLIKAMVCMLQMVDDSLADERIIEKANVPFQLNMVRPDEPSFFQLIFILDQVIYRYGFEVLGNTVVSEWLFGKPLHRGTAKRNTEKYHFKREGMHVEVNAATFKEGSRFATAKDSPSVYRENSLFLRVLAAFNGPVSKGICTYFNSIAFLDEYPTAAYYEAANRRLKDPRFLEKAGALIRAIDPTVHSISGKAPTANDGDWEPVINRTHGNGLEGHYLLLKMEAEGTKKVYGMSPYIFDALQHGTVLVVDEFDARMHPKLTRKIIALFHTPHTNPKGAQLIFVSHDTNLLDNALLRRDQILFAEKGPDGATELYSLVEIKGVRNDSLYEKEYLLGRYRAVPKNLNVLEEPFLTYGDAKKDEGGQTDQ